MKATISNIIDYLTELQKNLPQVDLSSNAAIFYIRLNEELSVFKHMYDNGLTNFRFRKEDWNSINNTWSRAKLNINGNALTINSICSDILKLIYAIENKQDINFDIPSFSAQSEQKKSQQPQQARPQQQILEQSQKQRQQLQQQQQQIQQQQLQQQLQQQRQLHQQLLQLQQQQQQQQAQPPLPGRGYHHQPRRLFGEVSAEDQEMADQTALDIAIKASIEQAEAEAAKSNTSVSSAPKPKV